MPSPDVDRGRFLCRFLPDRSRVTVSNSNDLELQWNQDGCVNGRTQYGKDGSVYTRIFVPNIDSSVSKNSFDPATGEYRVERFLLGLDAMNKARSVRQQYDVPSCDAGADAQTRLRAMQSAIEQVLPPQPNEMLVYQCSKAEG